MIKETHEHAWGHMHFLMRSSFNRELVGHAGQSSQGYVMPRDLAAKSRVTVRPPIGRLNQAPNASGRRSPATVNRKHSMYGKFIVGRESIAALAPIPRPIGA